MPVAAHDHLLELQQLLPALVEQGLITAQAAQKVAPASGSQHPLECIAAQGPCLETLIQWLARQVGQPYLRIDPLKIDVAAVVPLMSHAFAQRHGILAVAVDAHSVTVASAQPHITTWEAGLSRYSNARSSAWLPTLRIFSAVSTSFTAWPSPSAVRIKK